MRAIGSRLAALALALAAGSASALPLLAIDVDPGAAGIQGDRDVVEGEVFDVEVVISGVAPEAPLQAFELDLVLDPLRLGARSVEAGDFPGGSTRVLEAALGASEVDFALSRVGISDATGGGVLLRVRFEALAPGSSPLALERVLLSAPFGAALPFAAASGAGIRVLPVPEPAAWGLLLPGAAWLGTRRARRLRDPLAAPGGPRPAPEEAARLPHGRGAGRSGRGVEGSRIREELRSRGRPLAPRLPVASILLPSSRG